MARLPSGEEIRVANETLQPYFTALGRVAHAWNHLHEELGKVFCALSELDLSLGMTIWHSLKSDRSQREVLEGVLRRRGQSEEWSGEHPEASDGIRYLMKQVDKLAGRRNDAIHAPCAVIPGDFEIKPLTFFGNERAKSLRGKDILREFAWYEKSADVLRKYASDIRFALDARTAWPAKPQLPTIGQINTFS
jgi:hypothetical protein